MKTFWEEAVENLDGGWSGTDNKPQGWNDPGNSTGAGGDVGNTELPADDQTSNESMKNVSTEATNDNTTDTKPVEEAVISDEEEMSFWESALEDDEYCDSKFGSHGEFIAPSAPSVDETKPQIKSEKDNYQNDPEQDKGADELMKDDNSTEEVELEHFFDV